MTHKKRNSCASFHFSYARLKFAHFVMQMISTLETVSLLSFVDHTHSRIRYVITVQYRLGTTTTQISHLHNVLIGWQCETRVKFHPHDCASASFRLWLSVSLLPCWILVSPFHVREEAQTDACALWETNTWAPPDILTLISRRCNLIWTLTWDHKALDVELEIWKLLAAAFSLGRTKFKCKHIVIAPLRAECKSTYLLGYAHANRSMQNYFIFTE